MKGQIEKVGKDKRIKKKGEERRKDKRKKVRK